jgi:ketosteroid isomerase-like protein
MATATATPQTTQALQAMDDEFVRNVNAGDVEALVSAFYAEDAELLPPSAPVMRGHAEIKGCWKGMVSAGLNITVLEAKRIEESGGLAYASGVYELSLSPPGGGTIADNGKYVVVYRRQADGSWKAIADIFNSSRPAG